MSQESRCKEREPGWILGPYCWRRFNFVVSYDDLWAGFCRDRNDGAIYFAPLPGFIFGFNYKD